MEELLTSSAVAATAEVLAYNSTYYQEIGFIEPFLAAYVYTDYVGWVLAYVTLTLPILVVLIAVFSKVYYAREFLVILLGLSVNELVNFLLKIAVKDPRPHNAPVSYLHHSYGFPSSHAQAAFFLAVVLLFAIRKRWALSPNGVQYRLRLRPGWTLFWTIVLVLWAPLVAFSRYYLHYHTLIQVVVGAFLGTVFGWLWWSVWWFALNESQLIVRDRWLFIWNPSSWRR